MKRSVIAVLAVMVSTVAYAKDNRCAKNCVEWQGTCACDAPSMAGTLDSVKPSDEKPRRGQVPEWQTGEVIISETIPATEDASKFAFEQEALKAQIEFEREAKKPNP